MPAGIATLSAYLPAACADALTTRWRDDIEHDVAVRGGRHRLHEPVRTRSPRTYGTALPGMATYPARFYAKGATPSGRAKLGRASHGWLTRVDPRHGFRLLAGHS